jgi:hypothetical protein
VVDISSIGIAVVLFDWKVSFVGFLSDFMMGIGGCFGVVLACWAGTAQ